MSQLSDLRAVRKLIERGPSISPIDGPLRELTHEQWAEIAFHYKLWASSWVLPTIDVQIARLDAQQKRRNAK